LLELDILNRVIDEESRGICFEMRELGLNIGEGLGQKVGFKPPYDHDQYEYL
jgi:hypothetical protein